MHQYFGTVYPKSKKFKRMYNKNEEQKLIPNLFREHNIYLFQSNVYAVLSKALPRKSFCLKILLAMLKMTRFKKNHYHGPKFEIKF